METRGKGSKKGDSGDQSDLTSQLRQERRELVETLRKQGQSQDPVLLYRLLVVDYDLGLYKPSPP